MTQIQSLARGLTIIELLANHQDGISITELAKELDVNKSTASRLVQTLVKQGYVEQVPDSRRYQLSVKVVILSQLVINRFPLRDIAHPHLQRLVERTGECAHIAIYSMGQAYVLDDVETTSLLRVVSGIGRMAPLHCTAVGKCLLAFSDIPIPSNLTRMTAHTITNHESLNLHLREIREQGYAVDDEEMEIGIRCVAAPIYDTSQQVIATIGISGPAVRVTKERVGKIAKIIIQVSKDLTAHLNYNSH